MKHYTQLTQEQRYQIDAYCKAGLNQTETAEQLEVDKSTISREIRRGSRGDRAASHGLRIGVSVGQRVVTQIRQEWSPEPIRERAGPGRPAAHPS